MYHANCMAWLCNPGAILKPHKMKCSFIVFSYTVINFVMEFDHYEGVPAHLSQKIITDKQKADKGD